MQKNSTINDLKHELSMAKDRCASLENDKRQLDASLKSTNINSTKQIEELETVIYFFFNIRKRPSIKNIVWKFRSLGT